MPGLAEAKPGCKSVWHTGQHLVISVIDGGAHEGSCLLVTHLQPEAVAQIVDWPPSAVAGQPGTRHQRNCG